SGRGEGELAFRETVCFPSFIIRSPLSKRFFEGISVFVRFPVAEKRLLAGTQGMQDVGQTRSGQGRVSTGWRAFPERFLDVGFGWGRRTFNVAAAAFSIASSDRFNRASTPSSCLAEKEALRA
ncbi:unnamed protein product, partial [Phaeothamnion confervicola]